MAKFDLKEFARRGAQARAAELTAELESIYATFPELRRARGSAAASGDGAATRGRRRRRVMTAAQKKAVSVRMKKYWADRRKASSKS